MGDKMKKGDIVDVYEDPVSKSKKEGIARLLTLIEVLPSVGERWRVVFIGDRYPVAVDRIISK
jgi:hypothetical protein